MSCPRCLPTRGTPLLHTQAQPVLQLTQISPAQTKGLETTCHQPGKDWRTLPRASISSTKAAIPPPLPTSPTPLWPNYLPEQQRVTCSSAQQWLQSVPHPLELSLNVPVYTRELLVLVPQGPCAGSTRRSPEAEVPSHHLLAPHTRPRPAFRPAAGRVFTLVTLLCGRVISLSGVSVRKINYQSSSLAFSPTHHRTLKTNAKKIHFHRLGFRELGSFWILKLPCKLPSSGVIYHLW